MIYHNQNLITLHHSYLIEHLKYLHHVKEAHLVLNYILILMIRCQSIQEYYHCHRNISRLLLLLLDFYGNTIIKLDAFFLLKYALTYY